jgi:membrane peptidoglycan carboxypeptidase
VRKLKELLITRRLEAELSKRRILEIYLNVIEWGDGIFGAEAAARAYFGKPAAALTPDEAALLAGAIINPREHSPAKPTARLLRRQQIIARRMGIKPATAPPVESQVIEHTPATEPPRPEDSVVGFSPINHSPPAPIDPAQSVQPMSGNGGPPPLSPTKPTGSN